MKTHNSPLKVFIHDIKLSHSIFAMPFVFVALTMLDLSNVTWSLVLNLIPCMVFARSFAMGVNRYFDRDFDAGLARTRVRALPSGKTTPGKYLFITTLFGLGFVISSFAISPTIGLLSPLLLVILGFYSFMKRLSWLTHWYLGFCLGLTPVAVTLALNSTVDMSIISLSIAIMMWTSGFDLLYSLQDREYDTKLALHSFPVRFGHVASIWTSRACFALMTVFLVLAGIQLRNQFWWNIGVGVVACLLVFEHWLVRDALKNGSSKNINLAFFNLNASVSAIFMIFALVNAYV